VKASLGSNLKTTATGIPELRTLPSAPLIWEGFGMVPVSKRIVSLCTDNHDEDHAAVSDIGYPGRLAHPGTRFSRRYSYAAHR
jgi:hypothetical protein